MKKIRFKHLLAVLFFLLLWVTLVQQLSHLFDIAPLKGYYEKPENINLTFKKWADGSYHTQKETYINNTFAMRPFFVRIYGQIKFSLTHLSTNGNIIIGKDNYLYERPYIDAYNGDDYAGDEAIKKKVSAFKELQDTLQQRGICLFAVFAPGKSSFYPEFIPDEFKKERKPTNYETYMKYCSAMGVNYLDFVAWFNAMKDTSRYALFPRDGVHWTNYGEFIAFDSMINYLDSKHGMDVSSLKLNSVDLTRTPRMRDYDIGEALNIYTNLSNDVLAYPNYSVADTSKPKPKLLCIADSYYYQMFYWMSPRVFSDADFWYYFTDLYNINAPTRHMKDLNFKDFILSKKVICIMYNYSQLHNFGNTFIESANQEFKTPSNTKKP